MNTKNITKKHENFSMTSEDMKQNEKANISLSGDGGTNMSDCLYNAIKNSAEEEAKNDNNHLNKLNNILKNHGVVEDSKVGNKVQKKPI